MKETVTEQAITTPHNPLPQYKSHKTVHAIKIGDVRGGAIHPQDNKYAPFTVPDEYIARHNPQSGGYYVLYEDGYASFSPAESFESGYSQIHEVACPEPNPINPVDECCMTSEGPSFECKASKALHLIAERADPGFRAVLSSLAVLAFQEALQYSNEARNWQEEARRYFNHDLDACKLVSEMHFAATGCHDGPIRGVVEDVADLKKRYDELVSFHLV